MKKSIFHYTEKLCKKIPYLLRGKGYFFVFASLLLFLYTPNLDAQITKVYPNTVTGNSHVNNANNVLTETNYATLNSYGGVIAGVGDYSGLLTLNFDTSVPAGTTTFIKIDFDNDILNVLLGGNLGGALADLLATVVLGEHTFEVNALSNSTSVLASGNAISSSDGFTTEEVRLVINPSGDYLLAVTPSANYNKITIEDITTALALGSTNSMKVYYAYHTEGTDICENAFATSYSGSGGTIDALGLGNAGVNNPSHAIDENDATFSEMSLGLLSLAGSVSQTIYFRSPSGTHDQFHITLGLDDLSLLNLGLGDGIKVEALLGTNVVYTQAVDENFLNLNLLNLLNNLNKATIPFSPETPFDKVRISLNSTLQLNLTKVVKVYGVYRSVGIPINIEAPDTEICYNHSTNLSAETDTDNELVWYTDYVNGTLLGTTASNETYTTTNLTTNTTLYVAAKYCGTESERIPISIEVAPIYGYPDLILESSTN